MKIGLAQINTRVGDLTGNQEKILQAYHQLCQQGAELVVFPELTITSYPPRDLIFKSGFVTDNRTVLETIAAQTEAVPAVVGFIDSEPDNNTYYNAAAWCVNGRVEHRTHKCLLPSYDVFDDQRYFHAGIEPTLVEYRGQRIGLSICEDIWTSHPESLNHHYAIDPVQILADRGIDLLVNLSASPWHCGKGAMRAAQIGGAAQRCACPVVYCNSIGGNDELIFDGHSQVFAANGELIGELTGFAEASTVIDTDVVETYPFNSDREEVADVHDALVLGLRDYAHKSGFHTAVLGLSGGIDSAVTAVLAVRALGADNVMGLSLPSFISSRHSRDDAAALAAHLGIRYHSVAISETVAAAEQALTPLFAGRERDVTEENLQARSRGLLLMAVSNKLGTLLLTTGNKSELAVGYCTLYGDMCGGLAVISDVPKTWVYQLAQWINRENEIIPASTLTKPPSAELRPDQKDEDSLPPYPILDAILERYVEQGRSIREIVQEGFDPQVVREIVVKVDRNEYKRKQAAPGLKITPLAFGVGRRIPIVQKYTEPV